MPVFAIPVAVPVAIAHCLGQLDVCWRWVWRRRTGRSGYCGAGPLSFHCLWAARAAPPQIRPCPPLARLLILLLLVPFVYSIPRSHSIVVLKLLTDLYTVSSTSLLLHTLIEPLTVLSASRAARCETALTIFALLALSQSGRSRGASTTARLPWKQQLPPLSFSQLFSRQQIRLLQHSLASSASTKALLGGFQALRRSFLLRRHSYVQNRFYLGLHNESKHP